MRKAIFIVLMLVAVLIVALPCYAALDLAGVTVDTAPVFDLALIIVTAIAGIWGIKKVIKLGNRS